jgi:predicted metal-dependent hydrolase
VEIEVVRSARRRKTVAARQVDGVLRISIPATMTRAEEQRWVGEMSRRFERRTTSAGIDIEARAATLARRYDLPRARSIRWVDNQQARWGSCTPADGSIRLSSRLAGFPSWVLDHVIVHELAHLVEPGHGPAFQALVARHPLGERATGFLLAMSRGEELEGGSPDGGADEAGDG